MRILSHKTQDIVIASGSLDNILSDVQKFPFLFINNSQFYRRFVHDPTGTDRADTLRIPLICIDIYHLPASTVMTETESHGKIISSRLPVVILRQPRGISAPAE